MSERQPKVFVTQYMASWNFAEAENYGEVVFLTNSEYRPEPTPVGANDVTTREITKNLADYRRGHDYIVMTGSAIPNFVVGFLLGRQQGSHRILKWSARYKRYELFVV